MADAVTLPPALAYLAHDRRQALAEDVALPEHAAGTVLFADISGFMPLTEALTRAYGWHGGAEALTFHLNRVYAVLIAEVERYGGSVVGFSGDAITCWFDAARSAGAEASPALRAATSALAMQAGLNPLAAIELADGTLVRLAVKIVITSGAVRRLWVGAPERGRLDVLVGEPLVRLRDLVHVVHQGEILLDTVTTAALGAEIEIAASATPAGAALVACHAWAAPAPWPTDACDAPEPDWLLPTVAARLASGLGDFLTELRPAAALFLRFGGIDFVHAPEAGAQLDAFVRWVQGVVVHHGGVVLDLTVGDKGAYLYACFGAPVTHEDDARRASMAALELRAPPAQFAYVWPVQIGLSYGVVRTGAYGSATRRAYGVLGAEVNLAARLMEHAEAAQVLATRALYNAMADRRVVRETRIMWEPLPAVRLKGRSEPVEALALLDSTQVESFRLPESYDAAPCIGRDLESALAVHQLVLAQLGIGQIIGITGESGIGKSRFVAEIVRQATSRRVVCYGGACQSTGENTPYLAWHAVWRGIFGIVSGWSEESVRTTLEFELEDSQAAPVAYWPLLGPALNLSLSDNETTRGMDAKTRHEALQSLLVAYLVARSHDESLVIVLEDCHWLDPLAQDLLERISGALWQMRLALILVYRPLEASARHVVLRRVLGRTSVKEIVLGELSAEAMRRLIATRLGWAEDAPEVEQFAQYVARRTQGNPFYIEELLRYILDAHVNWRTREALEGLELPVGVQRLVLARMDRLSERARATLKIASVVGRAFTPELLCAYAPVLGADQQVEVDLQDLTQIGLLVYDAAAEPVPVYVFRHAITQEVAYGSLEQAMRAAWHERLAAHLEHLPGGETRAHIDLLAYHYGRSANQAKQHEYLWRAGEAALAAYANTAAQGYFEALLALLPVDDLQHARVRLQLGGLGALLGEWERAEVHLKVVWEQGAQAARAQAALALGDLYKARGALAVARTWLLAAHQTARAQADALSERAACAALGALAWNEGVAAAQTRQYREALAHYADSLAWYRQAEDWANVALLSSTLSDTAARAGDYGAARTWQAEALAVRQKLGDGAGEVRAWFTLGRLAAAHGDVRAARAAYAQGVVRAQAQGDARLVAQGLVRVAETWLDAPDAPEDGVRAARVCAAVQAWQVAGHGVVPGLAALITRARAAVPQEAVWAEGAGWELAEAVRVVG